MQIASCHPHHENDRPCAGRFPFKGALTHHRQRPAALCYLGDDL